MKTKEAMKALQGKTMAELDTDLQNTAAINECRKSIARVKTVIRQREMAEKA